MSDQTAEKYKNAWHYLPHLGCYDASSFDSHGLRFELCTNIELTGMVEYLYMVVAYRHGESSPAMIVSAESSSALKREKPGCYAFGRFDPSGHSTLDVSADYADPMLFLAAALKAFQQAGLIPEVPRL